MADSAKMISVDALAKHSQPDDLWIVVNGKVYDMTRWAPEHPGGPDSGFPVLGFSSAPYHC